MIEVAPEIIVTLMFVGILVGLFLLGHPIAFVLAGLAIIFALIGWGPEAWYLLIGRTFDVMKNNLLIAVALFILMACFLEKGGIAEGLFKGMMYIFGPINGSITLAVVVLCVVMAACTGIMGATVVSMSLMAIPVMMKHNYDKHLATGTVAAAGTLGIIIPPSIMLVLMADQSGISVGRLFAGGIGPGVVLGTLYFGYILVRTRLNPKLGPALSIEERAAVPVRERLRLVTVNMVPPLALIFGVLGSIWLGVATPTEASGVGAFIALVLMIIYRRFTWRKLKDAVWMATRTNCMVMAIIVGASLFTAVFIGLGGGEVVTELVMSVGFLGKWAVFAVMMLIVFVLGFMIDWIGIVYITFPLFLPIAAHLGFDTVWFVILMAVNLQMSFLTPPVGYALFYLKGTVPEGITLTDVYRGIIPFVILQVIGLSIVVMFPPLATWLPSFIAK
ncbi:C4-dicarboxylate TRAP transporter large permease protein DctM [subsurface metagenome]